MCSHKYFRFDIPDLRVNLQIHTLKPHTNLVTHWECGWMPQILTKIFQQFEHLSFGVG